MRNDDGRDQGPVDTYGASYDNYASDLYETIRRETYGEGIHGTGWMDSDEQDRFLSWLDLGGQARVLDVASGGGGPAIRIAAKTGCHVFGVDVHESAVTSAAAAAGAAGFGDRVRFEQGDAGRELPYATGSFDAITCIDAINHLPDRARVLADWHRLLKPGGRLLFTDPIVVSGPLSSEEIRIRSSIGFFLFVAPDTDERLLEAAGFEVVRKEDRTENMARIAGRWGRARAAREDELRRIEGDETYDGQVRFFDVTTRLAEERRLSRFAYLGLRPS